MENPYPYIIALLHAGFAGVLCLLQWREPVQFVRRFAWSWAIEAVRAVILLPAVHNLGGRPNEWFCLADMLCFLANWQLFSACAILVGARLPRWLGSVYVGAGVPLVLLGRYVAPMVLRDGFGWTLEQGEFHGVLGNLVVMFVPVLAARVVIFGWLFQLWRGTRLPGALIAALFCLPYAVIAAAVPFQYYFSFNPGWVSLLWMARVFGFSIGIVILLVDRQQRSLQQSEQRLRAILDTEPECVKLLAADGSLLEMNPAGLRMIEADGFQQVANRCVFPLVAPEHREAFRQFTASVFAGQSGLVEFEIVGLKGGRRWLETRATALRDEAGQATALLGITRDITARKRADEERRESESALHSLAEALPQIVWITRPDGWNIFFNQRWMDYTGLTREESLGHGWNKPFHPDDQQRAWQAWQLATETICAYSVECRLRRADGVYRWWLIRGVPARDAAGQITKWFGTCTDIDELKRAGEALRASEARARAIADFSPVGIFMADPEGRILYENGAVRETLGVDPLEAIGDRWATAIHPDDQERVFENWNQFVAGDRPDYNLEFRFLRPDRTARRVHARATRIRDGDHLLGFAGTAVDITDRKRMEDELRDSVRLTRQIIDGWYGFVALCSLDGVLLDANEAPFRATGFRREEVIGRPFWDAECWRHDEAAQTELKTAVLRAAAGELVRTEPMLRLRDGIFMTMDATFSPLRNSVGEITHVLGFGVDITERLRAEESLRLRSAALEAAANAILITDRDGVIQWINRAFTTLSGFTAPEAVGQRPNLVKSGSHGPAFYNDLWQTVLSGRAWHGQIVNRHKDGRLFVCEQTIAPVKDVRGEIRHFVSVQQDITDRTKAEEELRWRTAFFEAQVDSALDGILVVDSQGRKILQNQRMNELWKFPQEVIESKDDAVQVEFAINQAKNPELFREKVEYLYAHPDMVSRDEIELVDGTILDRYSSPVRDKFGKYFGRIWTFRDMTKTRQLEEQFRQAQKMEAIGQLAGGVAHDFNNILAAIMMQADLALTAASPAENKNYLQEIKGATGRAANLTRQLLAFSRRQVMQPRLLDLNEVVTSLAKMLQRIVSEDVQMQFNLHPSPLLLRADAGMLDQALLNLVVNARDAMPQGGLLFIATSEIYFTGSEAALIPDASPGRHVCLRVTDTGSGIAPEVLPRIFEPFFTTKQIGQGTGLGLATVFGIVKQHGGSVTVSSEVGRGATFCLFFSASEEPASSGDGSRAKAAPRGGSETILLVEDEPSVRALTRIVLQRAGYHVLESADGVDALRVWEQHRDSIQLLLTDIVMPEGISGRDLAARLLEHNPKLRVLFTSGYSTEIAGREIQLQEGQNFLAKPCLPDQILETVRACLDG